MRQVGNLITNNPKLGGISNDMSDEDWQKFLVDIENKKTGHLNDDDGYDCPICLNKGKIFKAEKIPAGWWTMVQMRCKCMETRRTINRMKQSGLENIIKDFTFGKFEASEPWQKTLKDAAMGYAKAPTGWFFIGGQSGVGKSMLCVGICREFLLAGRQVVYMPWRDDVMTLKGLATDSEQRAQMLDRFKTAEILCIDDLFKTADTQDGSKQRPTTADITTAFEILNYRYNNPQMLTVISSEWTQSQIIDIDEATGGRIFERAGIYGFNIAPDRAKNYRLRGGITL